MCFLKPSLRTDICWAHRCLEYSVATAFLEGGVGLLQVEGFRKCLLKEKARAGNVVQLVEGSLACAGWIPRVCRPRIAARACNPSTLEVLAGEAEVQGRPWYTVSSKLPETLSQTQTDRL